MKIMFQLFKNIQVGVRFQPIQNYRRYKGPDHHLENYSSGSLMPVNRGLVIFNDMKLKTKYVPRYFSSMNNEFKDPKGK